jgi:hypothetical protein
MNRFKMTTALVCLLTASFAPAVRADGHTKETRLTLSQSLQIRSTVLTPGQYLFKLAEPDSNHSVVNIFEAGSGRLVATVIGTQAYRADYSDREAFTISQPQGRQPGTLKWFYPGDNFGVELPVR